MNMFWTTEKHYVSIKSLLFPYFFFFFLLPLSSFFFQVLTSSLTPYSFSTFFFSCLKHSSMRSWKGRRSSVTLFPWREIPPPSNGIYKQKLWCQTERPHKGDTTLCGVCMCSRKCVNVFSTCHAMRSLRRSSLSLSSGCCWLYSSVKNAWYRGNNKNSFKESQLYVSPAQAVCKLITD